MRDSFLIYFFKTKKIFNNIHVEKKFIFLKKNKIKILFFWIKIFFKLFNLLYSKKVVILKSILLETFFFNNDLNKNKFFLNNKEDYIFLKLLQKNNLYIKNEFSNIKLYSNNPKLNNFFLVILNFFKKNKKFYKNFKFFKKKFLIFKKFKWLYLYWSSIIYKKHLLIESKNRSFLKIRRYWHVFDINDDVTRFRLKIDDGIGNDWVYFIRFSKLKSLVKLKKKLIFHRIIAKKKKKKRKLRIISERNVLKKKQIQLKKTEIYNKKKDSAIIINQIRQKKIIELRDDIYYKVTGRRFFSIFKNKKLVISLKKNSKSALNYNIFLKNWSFFFLKNFLVYNFLIFFRLRKKLKKLRKIKKKFFIRILKKKIKYAFLKKKILKFYLIKKKKIKKKKIKKKFFFKKKKKWKRRKKKFFIFYFFWKIFSLKKRLFSFFFNYKSIKLRLNSIYYKKNFNFKKKNLNYYFINENLSKKKIDFKNKFYALINIKKFKKNKINLKYDLYIKDFIKNLELRNHFVSINFLTSSAVLSKKKLFIFTSKSLIYNMNLFYQYQYEYWLLRILFLNNNVWKWIKFYLTDDRLSRKQKVFLNANNIIYTNFSKPIYFSKLKYKHLLISNKKNKTKNISKILSRIIIKYFRGFFNGNFYIYLQKISWNVLTLMQYYTLNRIKDNIEFELIRPNFKDEFIGICIALFSTRDPKFLVRWIVKTLNKISFKKHWKFIYQLKVNFLILLKVFLKLSSFKGIHIIIKGKIGALGSFRKKTVHIRHGIFGLSRYNLAGDFMVSYAHTQTGKIGVKIITCYEPREDNVKNKKQ